MGFKCRDENCNKEFSTKLNRYKHERNKGHAPGNVDKIIATTYDSSGKQYKCPTPYCATISKYRENITKHIKLCYNVNKKTENRMSKICSFCGKTFSIRFDSDRYIKHFHGTASNNGSLMEDQEQKEEIPGE